jgi:hypothetical protein
MVHPTLRYLDRFAVRAVLFFIALTLVAGRAGAFEIRGTVVNGTTGKPVGPIKVAVVDPRHGMATEGEIQTDAKGVFVAGNLDEKISMFLIQVNYEGVTYTEILRPGEDTVDAVVKVYDTTPAWDDVRVSLPHLMARRSNDTLSVDRIFFVSNNTNPPKTITGQGAGFRVYVPEDHLQITSLFVTSIGVPIPVSPHPTETPGIYTVDYPFKPGETRVGVSFDVAYADTGYAYAEPLQYALDEAVAMAEDPTMEVTSETLDLGKPEEVRGLEAYRLRSLPRSSTLALRFRGGHAKLEAPASGHEIVTVRNLGQNVSVAVMVGFTLLLVLVMAFATKSPLVETDETALLTSRKNALLNRIAKLDDLFEMGTVPDQLYRDKRSELVETLARIIYQIDKLEPKKSKIGRERNGAPHAR